MSILPADHDKGHLVFRVWRPDAKGPSVCTLRSDGLYDVTGPGMATVSHLLEHDDPVAALNGVAGTNIGTLATVVAASDDAPVGQALRLLAPVDLQAIKACGVTFARSMLERVIEEQAKGDPSKAEAIRTRCTAIIGDSLANVVPGSQGAQALKAALIAEGVWSQYLEVGIGPDAEVFSKSQPMSAVGWGAAVGLHPISSWNNPEPEVVLACNSAGQVKGAMLGNDVNLRDVEGRSALLLGKAKDNNASCALGPFIRLFDEGYGIDDVRKAELELTVRGTDGFEMKGHSSMAEISRDPLELVAQTCGAHHQYPDGFVLFLGTLFAPTEDRDAPGEGFTHKIGDRVTIANDRLGSLENTVRLSTECPPWTFGTSALMRNLGARNLI